MIQVALHMVDSVGEGLENDAERAVCLQLSVNEPLMQTKSDEQMSSDLRPDKKICRTEL